MRAFLEVDLRALKHNVKTLSKITAPGFFCPIVKANSYGHGVLEISQALQSMGVKQVGVVSLEEALEIACAHTSPKAKKISPKIPSPSKNLKNNLAIYILGPLDKEQISYISLYGFIPIVGQWADLKNLALFTKRKNKALVFHLKFNTGMNRFGFLPSEKEALLKYIQKYPLLKLKGLSSHLSEGEKASSQTGGSAFHQIQTFKKVCDFFKKPFPQSKLNIHLLNSAGWFSLWCHNHIADLQLGFRPGLSLYGVKPPVNFLTRKAKEKYHSLDLRPVACLKSFVVQSYVLPAGRSVSYGGKWKSKKKSTLAVVSMGYADGLPYSFYKTGEVLFRGERAPIAGHICMDFFMIDVTKVAQQKEIKKGEEVIIFGAQKRSLNRTVNKKLLKDKKNKKLSGKNFISVEEQATKAGTIPHDFLTHIGNRVKRIYQGE